MERARDVIVIGASAGGFEALIQVVQALPAELPAAVFVVLHVPPHWPSRLPAILTQAGPLPAAHAVDGEAIVPGRIYVAPPDRHLVVRPGHVHLSCGPREEGSRPAANPLFRTAARRLQICRTRFCHVPNFLHQCAIASQRAQGVVSGSGSYGQ